MSANQRLTRVFKEAKEITFDNSDKYVVFSDCHRGDGSWADDFAHNERIFFHALNYYYGQEFTYIETGDGDELWENSRFEDIKQAHSQIFWKLSQFYQNKRLYLIWGNHNRRWKNYKQCQKDLSQYYDERDGKYKPLFEGIIVYEGLVLRQAKTGSKVFLVHGHQVDYLNDTLWWFSRFIVRNFWKLLQLGGAKDPTSPAKNFRKRNKIEKAIIKWVEEKNQIVLAGHTHRSVFPSGKEPPYINAGSCVHPRCILAIEIENGSMILVKWFVNVNDDGTLFMDRKLLEGPRKIDDLVRKLVKKE